MSKNFIVVPGNTDLNRGDQALIWESIRIVKDAGIEGEFILLKNGETEKEIYMQSRQTIEEGYSFLSPILPHPSRGKNEENGHYYSYKQILNWGTRAVIDGSSRSLLLNDKLRFLGRYFLESDRRDALENIKNCKGVIVKGGGFIHSYGGITSIYHTFYSIYHILLAKKMGKKVLVMPNSFGPFEGHLVKGILRNSLSNCELITARETISANALSDLLKKEVPVYPDLGFFLEGNDPNIAKKYLLERGVPLKDKICVGITLRPYRFPKSEEPIKEYDNYINNVVEFVSYLKMHNYHIVFIAQTLGPSNHEDDRIAIRDVLNKSSNESITFINDEDLNCRDIKAIYAEMDYLIGTRFHSVIFALSSGVPSIAIAYGGNKGEGIMRDMNLNEYVLNIEGLNSKSLIEKFESLKTNNNEIKSKINMYLLKANKERENLKKVISNIFNE
ncbi:polysaccharide pyruvyl transferase family protein [Paenibacillus sp. FSL E2-0201]|uniref:polysaccharide pyruvyl transferase family protein n=1 Tax=Paenibacillus sp. FSL E2-0201 TaxID=2954726 RepID=UPI0030DC632D